MSEGNSEKKDPAGISKITAFSPGPASEAMVSLSQVILAPLDALAKGQIHAARSFLNFLLQMGYPHQPMPPTEASPTGGDGDAATATGTGAPQPGSGGGATSVADQAGKTPKPSYSMTFRMEQTPAADQIKKFVDITIPTLSLVPAQPLGIESAEYSIELVIREVAHHRQIQASEKESLQMEKAANNSSREAEDPTSRKHEPRPWYLVSDPISVRGTLTDPGGDGQAQRQASVKVNVKVSRSPIPAGLAKLLSAMTQVVGVDEAGPQSSSSSTQ